VNLRNSCLCGSVLIATLVIAACGSGSVNSHTSSPPVVTGQSGCWRGKMALGSDPRAIDFSVGCTSAQPRKEFILLLTRDSLSGPRGGPGIHAFRKFPPMSGPGVIESHGRCHLGGYTLGCRGRFRGRFEMRGRIWVSPQTRCSANVALALNESPRHCTYKHVCFAILAERPLLEGLPGGC
jgi:hypothetical protein